MIELFSAILAVFVLMAVSLWLAAFFRIPIQVDSVRGARVAGRGFDFESGKRSSTISGEPEDAESNLAGSRVVSNLKRFAGSPIVKRAPAEVVHGDEAALLLYKLAAGHTGEAALYTAECEVALIAQSNDTWPTVHKSMVRIKPEKNRRDDFEKN